METLIVLAKIIGIIIVLMIIMGLCFQNDLNEMEHTHPEYRKYLKDKYGF